MKRRKRGEQQRERKACIHYVKEGLASKEESTSIIIRKCVSGVANVKDRIPGTVMMRQLLQIEQKGRLYVSKRKLQICAL